MKMWGVEEWKLDEMTSFKNGDVAVGRIPEILIQAVHGMVISDQDPAQIESLFPSPISLHGTEANRVICLGWTTA